MLKILLKRQLYEFNRSFFYDTKKGKSRSKFASAAFIVLYALLMVFNTYAALYKANDNDLLLSLPVPVGSILLSRLLGVYLMGLMFSAVVFVPAAIVYLCIDFSVGTLLGCILGMLSISVFVFVLSCALGWVVAKIASKLKRKSFLTVIISLVFIGGYYYVVNNITTLLMQFTQYAGAIGAGVKNFAYPVYLFRRMSAGNLVSAPLPVFGTAALASLTFYVMSKSFLKLATASSDTVTAKYNRNARQKASGVFPALLKRELGRFTASPAYMLNCGFGVIIMPIAGILLLIRGAALRSMLPCVHNERYACAVRLFGRKNALDSAFNARNHAADPPCKACNAAPAVRNFGAFRRDLHMHRICRAGRFNDCGNPCMSFPRCPSCRIRVVP